MSDNEFMGEIVLVTGAAQGIGAAVAEAFSQQGAKVAAVDVNKAAIEAKALELISQGGDVTAFTLDVRNNVAVQHTIAHIEEQLGPIDILVHAAGVLRLGPIVSYSDDDWSDTLGVNLSGVFHVSRAVSERMMPRRKGAIVTVSSNAAAIPRMDMAAYATSKAAVTMFTKCLGIELAEYGIRCNIVSPGSTDTPMLRAMWADEQGAERTIEGSLQTYRTGIPLRKLATPRDIAESVLFLASERAGHLTMHDLRVDGGATLGV
jgi:2,3-dihydro-2,3-dihydroxybenzoate dehydrogenase